MVDQVDAANAIAEDHGARAVDAACRAAAAAPRPYRGDCEDCGNEDVFVAVSGGIPRCAPCRTKRKRR